MLFHPELVDQLISYIIYLFLFIYLFILCVHISLPYFDQISSYGDFNFQYVGI